MAGNFILQEDKAEGFLSGLFSNKKVKKAVGEINNFLASANSIFELNSSIISDIARQNGISSVQQLKNELYNLYRRHLMYCFADRRIDEKDNEELKYLATLFNLNQNDCIDQANNVISNYIMSFYQTHTVSPEQALELDILIKELGTNYRIGAGQQSDIEKFKLYWNLENGIMRKISCDLLLANDEQCYLMMGAELYEFTTITKKIKHKGHGIGFSVLPGVSIGFGGGKSKVVTKDIMKKIESGNFYVTNKKIVFKGKRKSNAFKLDDVVDVEVNNKGVVIVDTNGYNPTYEIHGDKKELELVIRYVINNYNQQT